MLNRGRFLKIGLTGAVAVAVGAQAKLLTDILGAEATAAPAVYDLRITDAVVEMVNLEPVYHWVFADAEGAHLPGPVLHALEGDTISLRVTNTLDEPHAFAIHGTGVSTGPIAPGATADVSFPAPAPGTYIYLDPLNAPVNRLLGLHGMLVVLPADTATPYAAPPPRLAALFGDLGDSAHFPGEPWLPERTRLWHTHCTDPRWHARAEAGQAIDAGALVADFRPEFFTLNGESGFFASHNPANAPVGRLGQPHLIRIANTGLLAYSLHIHGNHVYVCAVNGVPQSSVRFIDSWQTNPLDTVDWLLPFERPPDIPGPESRPLRDALRGELSYRDPLGIPQCPIEYPMHCHMEPSQTARGGNYPGGLVTHWMITGDLDMDFADAGFDCEPTEVLAARSVDVGHAHG
jgi:FtsP/CotA-like multicopper oxidase with cupredoxin domain